MQQARPKSKPEYRAKRDDLRKHFGDAADGRVPIRFSLSRGDQLDNSFNPAIGQYERREGRDRKEDFFYRGEHLSSIALSAIRELWCNAEGNRIGLGRRRTFVERLVINEGESRAACSDRLKPEYLSSPLAGRRIGGRALVFRLPHLFQQICIQL